MQSEWLAIAFVAIIVVGLAGLAVSGHFPLLPNFGFGQDWNCSYLGRGEPVCLKQQPKPTSPHRETN